MESCIYVLSDFSCVEQMLELLSGLKMAGIDPILPVNITSGAMVPLVGQETIFANTTLPIPSG